MRKTLNISMSPKLLKRVEAAVDENDYSSVSEFFRDALRAWEDEQLYQSVMRSRQDVARGRYKRLRSLRDLM